MYLRRGVNCVNGRQFDADAVLNTYNKNQEMWKAVGVQSLEALDNFTVQLSLDRDLLAQLMKSSLSVLADPELSIQCH
jgi:hypothetical protein